MYITDRFKPSDMNDIVTILTSIFDTSNDGLYVCDAEGYGLLYNDANLEINGISSDVASNNLYDYLENDIIPNSAATVALETKKPHTAVIDYYNGKKAVVTATPFFNDENDIIFVVSQMRDITEINRLHAELERTRKINTTFQKVFEKMKATAKSDEDLIFSSDKMFQIKSLAAKLSNNDSPILILGESGTGKNVLADYIHKKSGRKGNMVKINCGAIPVHLIESELFGHEKGAFTGANKQKIGLFELAHEGSIFLDEIGDLPFELQVKLLNVLQESKIRRVGGTKTIDIDTRVIAATNMDLSLLVEQQKFRLDLYYRLNVLSLTIPPLRERQEDIITLLFYQLHKLEEKYKKEILIDDTIIEKLVKYNWPGNIRELNNLIERLYHMSDYGKITLEHLPSYITEYEEPTMFSESKEASFKINPLREAVKQFEKSYISKALLHTSTMQECSDLLGINISTLVRKKRNLGIK